MLNRCCFLGSDKNGACMQIVNFSFSKQPSLKHIPLLTYTQVGSLYLISKCVNLHLYLSTGLETRSVHVHIYSSCLQSLTVVVLSNGPCQENSVVSSIHQGQSLDLGQQYMFIPSSVCPRSVWSVITNVNKTRHSWGLHIGEIMLDT